MRFKRPTPHIVELFENGHKTAEGQRETRTKVIENCFKKEGSKWVLDLDNPHFKESNVESN